MVQLIMRFKRSFWPVMAAMLMLAACTVTAQSRSNRIYRPCSGTTTPAKVEIIRGGAIRSNPCSGKTWLFTGPVQIRDGIVDETLYAAGLDLVSYWATGDSRDGVYFEFNLGAGATSSVYRGLSNYFAVTSTATVAAAVGSQNDVVKTGSGTVHDITGAAGSATVTAGAVTSGVYGLGGSVGIFGGSGHGDITDLRVGTSSITNTTARSYQTIWVTRPTITNLTLTQAGLVPLAFRVDSATRVPSFTVDHDGQMRIINPVTPASATATCSVGAVAWDADYIYICVAADTWKRTAISTW